MTFHILTIFPDFFRGPLDYGIVERARALVKRGGESLDRAIAQERAAAAV